MNPRELKVEKLTMNIGVGESGEKLDKAKKLLERITGRTAVLTCARKREQSFKIQRGETIGTKVTIRGKPAEDLLKRAFDAIDRKLSVRSFDKVGNFSFGVKEYIDFPGVKYDPTIGLVGFDICVTLGRSGKRVAMRRRKQTKLGKGQYPNREEAIEFVKAHQVNVYE
jgi:large subunit ribosomal protein L5